MAESFARVTCLLPVFTVVLLLSSISLAFPIDSRDINQSTFDNLNFYSQFAAAAYCPSNNNNNAGNSVKIACPTYNNCPLVEQDDVESVLQFQNSLLTDVTGYVAVDNTNEQIVVSFRGTHSIRNILTDAFFNLVDIDLCSGCTASDGFWTSYNEARSSIVSAVQSARSAHSSYSLIVTGHSLGGALATLAATDLRNRKLTPLDLYTYGSPRTGNDALASYIESAGQGQNFRVTHADDPVPRVPPAILGFQHVQPQFWIDAPTDVVPTDANIDTYTDTSGGDEGDDDPVNIFNLDIPAHLWYFGNISSCDHGQGVEW